jgi:hypothetical protein
VRRSDATGARWLAMFPPIAVALLMLGGGLTPKGLDRPITGTGTALSELATASPHPGQVYLSSVLIILGLAALGVSFVVIALLAGAPGSRVATSAAAIGAIGCLSAVVVNVLFGIDLAGTAAASATRGDAARILVSIGTAPGSTAFLVVYLAGVLVAGILTGITLWRSRAVARWIAVGFPVCLALGSAAPAGIASVVLSLPFAVIMVLVSVRIWRTWPVTGAQSSAAPTAVAGASA